MTILHVVGFATLLLALVLPCQGQNYVAEGYFVVDAAAVDLYVREMTGPATYAAKRELAVEKMAQDIEYTVTEINELFKSLRSSGLNLEIRKRRVDILSRNFIPQPKIFNGTLISNEVGLETFAAWLAVRYAFRNLRFDFAIYWTGYGLYKGQAGRRNLGASYLGKACDPIRAVGVVQYKANYGTAVVTAQQIAHLLGANNDGVASNYLLTPRAEPTLENRWSFSPCSATSMQEFIEFLHSDCLSETSPDSTVSNQSLVNYTSDMLDPDTICRRHLNDTRSYLCKAPIFYNQGAPRGNAICQSMFCRIPGTTKCVATYPAEGMICDNNSRCDDGLCKLDLRTGSAPTDSNCLFGDQSNIQFSDIQFSGTCSQLIQEKGRKSCYNLIVQLLCCTSCKDPGSPGCEYGDRSSDCMKYSQRDVCPLYGDFLCCDYCKHYRRKRSEEESSKEVVIVYQDVVDVGNGEEDEAFVEVKDIVAST